MSQHHRFLPVAGGIFLAALISGCALNEQTPAPAPAPASSKPPSATPSKVSAVEPSGSVVRTPSGLSYIDRVVGTGPSPEKGQRVTVHYTGRLKDGAKFDSSVDRGQPFSFIIGVGQVIKGWDEGVATMKVGGKRTLIIPSDLGYGDRGFGNIIPPKSELHFDVELLDVK